MKYILLLITSLLPLVASEALVSAEWLKKNLANKELRIIEVSESSAYKQGHIPGALNTPISSWRVNNGTYLQIKDTKDIEAEIRRLGIDERSHVVLYAQVSVPKDFLKASYVYWALHYHGVSKVSLLDGAQKAWSASGYELSTKPVKVKKSSFNVKLDTSKIADIDYVKKNIGKLPMIDARPADKYLGITPTATVKRNGHIKGAMSYSWNYSVDANYKLKPKQQLNELFAKGYSLAKDQEIIVYCTGGLETSFNYFVLSKLGYTNIRLYDASMKEWGNTDKTPMDKYRYETFVK